MEISSLKTNDLIAIHYPETDNIHAFKEYAIVTDVDEQKHETIIKPLNHDNIIIIPWGKADITIQIEDIHLSKIWVDKLGFKAKEGTLYLLPLKEYWYEQSIKANEYSIVIQIKIEKGEWVIVIPKVEAYFGCRFENVSTVRALQNIIRFKYGIELPKEIFDKLQ